MPARPLRHFCIPASILFAAVLVNAALAAPSHRNIRVDATAQPDAARDLFSYEIISRPTSSPDRPEFDEAVRHIRTALSGCGFYEAPDGVAPDVAIEVECGILLPRTETRTRSVPVHAMPTNGELLRNVPLTFVTEQYQVSVRLKYLMVTARPRGSSDPLWRVQAAIDDDTPALTPCLPLLAAAVMNHIGYDTGGTRTMKLSYHDTDVAFITQGLP